MANASDISTRIIEAIMAQKLAPGARLGEQQLAMVFDCSRTIVREALTRLAAQGLAQALADHGVVFNKQQSHGSASVTPGRCGASGRILGASCAKPVRSACIQA